MDGQLLTAAPRLDHHRLGDGWQPLEHVELARKIVAVRRATVHRPGHGASGHVLDVPQPEIDQADAFRLMPP